MLAFRNFFYFQTNPNVLENNLIKQYLLLIFLGIMKKERKKYKKLKKYFNHKFKTKKLFPVLNETLEQ